MSLRIIFLLLLTTFYSSAQQTYQRKFDFFGALEDALYLYGIDSISQSIKIHGLFGNPFDSIEDSLDYRQIYFSVVDSNGNTSYLKNYGRNKFNYLAGNSNWVYKLNDSVFKTIITFYDTLKNRTTQLWYLNTHTMDTLFTRNLSIPPKYVSADFLQLGDKFYQIGNIGSTSGDRMFFHVTDTSGNLILSKLLPPGYIGSFSNMMVTPNKQLLVGGSYTFNSIDPAAFVGWYALMDTLGNIVWDIKCDDSTRLFSKTSIWINRFQNDFYICGTEQMNNPFRFYPKTNNSFMGKIDIATGGILWLKPFLAYTNNTIPSIARFKEHNGFLYGTGVFTTNADEADQIDYALFLKLDKEGNVQWKRLYKEWTQSNRIWGMHILNDGFMFLGDAVDTTHNTGYADAWIIKTDTFGCVVPGCQLYDNVPQIVGPKISFLLYPNPATNQVTLSYKLKATDQLYVKVIDIAGKEIYSQISNLHQTTLTVETNQWKEGLYIIQFIGDGELMGTHKLLIQHE